MANRAQGVVAAPSGASTAAAGQPRAWVGTGQPGQRIQGAVVTEQRIIVSNFYFVY